MSLKKCLVIGIGGYVSYSSRIKKVYKFKHSIYFNKCTGHYLGKGIAD